MKLTGRLSQLEINFGVNGKLNESIHNLIRVLSSIAASHLSIDLQIKSLTIY